MFPSFGAVRWKNMGWLQSIRWSRKCFCRTEYNYCHKDCMRSLPRTVGILLLEVHNKASSPIWHLCALQVRWASSYPFLQVGRHRGSDLSCLSTETFTSNTWSQSFCILFQSAIMRDSSCLLPEGRRLMCSYCCWSYVQPVFADVLLVLTFLSSFRWFLFSCTAIHFSTWTALYFPFLFLFLWFLLCH